MASPVEDSRTFAAVPENEGVRKIYVLMKDIWWWLEKGNEAIPLKTLMDNDKGKQPMSWDARTRLRTQRTRVRRGGTRRRGRDAADRASVPRRATWIPRLAPTRLKSAPTRADSAPTHADSR